MTYEQFELASAHLPKSMRDWRFLTILGGVALILVGLALPMFTRHISQATVQFSGGTTVQADYASLVSGLNMAMGNHPTQETFVSVDATLVPVTHWASGYGWLATLCSQSSTLWRYLSLIICLAMPLVVALLGLTLYLRSRTAPNNLAASWVPATVNLGWAGLLALFLAWCHQFDFSFVLQRQYAAEFAPGVGFWVVALGVAAVFVGAFSFRQALQQPLLNWWALVFAVAMAIWLLVRFKPFPFLEIWLFIQDGILVTLRIVFTSFGFILLVSLLGGLGRISRSPIIYGIASLYVELIRGIPLMVQLLFIWFALPQAFDALGNLLLSMSPSFAHVGQQLIDLRLSPFTAAVFGLTFCYGAYGSEIFRAGISSIHRGQMEAARSLGMNYFQSMRHVVLPQAVRVILPPIGNEFVALLKDSSLVSVLAVSDLTRRGREYMARTFLSFDTWIMVALCYLVLTLFSSRAVEFIESKTRFER